MMKALITLLLPLAAGISLTNLSAAPIQKFTLHYEFQKDENGPMYDGTVTLNDGETRIINYDETSLWIRPLKSELGPSGIVVETHVRRKKPNHEEETIGDMSLNAKRGFTSEAFQKSLKGQFLYRVKVTPK